MIGAIIGDIAGSNCELHGIKARGFPLFVPGSNTTGDSLMSIAVASAPMQTGEDGDFKAGVVSSVRQIAATYPHPTAALGTTRQCACSLATPPRCTRPML